jgi:hypothetical protein
MWYAKKTNVSRYLDDAILLDRLHGINLSAVAVPDGKHLTRPGGS